MVYYLSSYHTIPRNPGAVGFRAIGALAAVAVAWDCDSRGPQPGLPQGPVRGGLGIHGIQIRYTWKIQNFLWFTSYDWFYMVFTFTQI